MPRSQTLIIILWIIVDLFIAWLGARLYNVYLHDKIVPRTLYTITHFAARERVSQRLDFAIPIDLAIYLANLLDDQFVQKFPSQAIAWGTSPCDNRFSHHDEGGTCINALADVCYASFEWSNPLIRANACLKEFELEFPAVAGHARQCHGEDILPSHAFSACLRASSVVAEQNDQCQKTWMPLFRCAENLGLVDEVLGVLQKDERFDLKVEKSASGRNG